MWGISSCGTLGKLLPLSNPPTLSVEEGSWILSFPVALLDFAPSSLIPPSLSHASRLPKTPQPPIKLRMEAPGSQGSHSLTRSAQGHAKRANKSHSPQPLLQQGSASFPCLEKPAPETLKSSCFEDSTPLSSVQSLSHVRLFATPWTQHARLPCPSPTPGACSNSCP